MTPQQVQNLIRRVVCYEYQDQEIDFEWTTFAVHRQLKKSGDLDTALAMDALWKQEEYLHACVLDYFSMREPITN